MVRVAWWLVGAIGCVTALWVYDGSGHEILLYWEVEEEKLLSKVGEVISMEG